MKRILLIVASLLLAFATNAQSKESALKAIEKAQATSLNEKKASNPTTWIKLGDAYVAAYNAAKGNALPGISQSEVKLFLAGEQVLGTENKDLNGAMYTVDHYEGKDLYYNSNGVLEMVVVTKPYIDDDILGMACDAYLKANELDPNGSKNKDLTEKLTALHDNYVTDAYVEYSLGNTEKAARLYEDCLKTTDNPVVNSQDSVILYYTALTYNAVGNTEKAKSYLNKCKEIGYGQNGNVYALLADMAKADGDTEAAKALLNEGFAAYPTSQTVLIALINLYLETNDDPAKILSLIHSAQQNEPENASLIWAEGNINKQIGNIDEAVKCYYRATEVDPTYVFGVYSVGDTYYNMAVDTQTKRDALDINDYKQWDIYTAQIDEYLMKAIEPFEKAFAITTEIDIQIPIAQQLKQIYFRFRDKGDEYETGYNKYKDFLDQHNAQ